MTELQDISDTIVPSSDQMNADDFPAPATVRILDVRRMSDKKQPIRIDVEGWDVPWLPCKTVRRLLVAGWGKNANAWKGRWVTLYCDPSVIYAGKQVGGIRISHMSDIGEPIEAMLSFTKGKRKAHRILPLTPPEQSDRQPETRGLTAIAADNEITLDEIRHWHESGDNGAPLPDQGTGQYQELCRYLDTTPGAIDEIRAMRTS